MKKLPYLFLVLLLACQGNKESKDQPLSPRFNHVFLNVSDMDRSVQFYTAAFDIEVTKQIKKIKRTPIGGETTEHEIFLSLLKFPNQNFILEIGENNQFLSNNGQASYTHLGVDVLNIDAASERIQTAGATMIRPVTLVEADDIQAKTAFFSGPDGETIELMQVISGDF